MKKTVFFLSLIIILLIYAKCFSSTTPTVVIDNVVGSTGTLIINYTTSDVDGDSVTTCGWQYSLDNSYWNDIVENSIENNSYKALGTSYIKWNSTVNANDVVDNSVWFRMKVVDDGEPGEIEPFVTSPNTLNKALSNHSTVVNNGYIYITGGLSNYTFNDCVYYTKINSDGSIGNLNKSANDIPTLIAKHSSVVCNGYLYVTGGNDGNDILDTVYYAKINANGSIDSFNMSLNNIPVPLESHSTVVYNGYIYVTGGYLSHDPDTKSDKVYYAKVNFDGSISSFTASANTLPAAQALHSSVVNNGYIYVTGGVNWTNTGNKVYYAKINADGSIDSFNTSPNNIPYKIFGPSSVVYDDFIYITGGDGMDLGDSNLVFYAKINGDGSIGSFSTSIYNIPDKLQSLSSVVYDGRIYLTGGSYSDKIYYTLVRNGLISEYASSISFVLKNKFPLAVGNLIATPINDSKIQLIWEKSVSEDVNSYRVYYSTSEDSMDYTFANATIEHPSISWTSPTLVSGKTYFFVVRSVDAYGREEMNTNLVSATAFNNLAGLLKTIIKTPNNGKKVSGNRLMILAELLLGNISEVKNILFEYKAENSNTWQTISAANINHPNPDISEPYFIHWDVSNLTEGDYNIRAVATNKNNIADSQPGYITITIDHTDPDVEEGQNSKGEHERKEKIDNRKNNTVKIGTPNKNTVTEVLIPEGAISENTGKISIVADPKDVAQPSALLNDIGEYREINLENAQLTGEVTISINYEDENDDEKIDDTDIPINTLCGFYYDEAHKKWKKLTTEIDKENKLVKIKTDHFSMFAVFGAPTTDYNGVIVYPNPYKPTQGHSWIKFDGLTASSKIEILDVSGNGVRKIENINTGEYIWDVTNQLGEDVVSGIYVCVISNNVGDKKIVKVAVIK